MKIYSGNRGIVSTVPEPIIEEIAEQLESPPVFEEALFEPPPRPAPPHRHDTRAQRPASPFGGLPFLDGLFGGKKPPEASPYGALGGFLNKLTSQPLELEDYLMLAVLYLLYRESGDVEFLIIAGLMFLL